MIGRRLRSVAALALLKVGDEDSGFGVAGGLVSHKVCVGRFANVNSLTNLSTHSSNQ